MDHTHLKAGSSFGSEENEETKSKQWCIHKWCPRKTWEENIHLVALLKPNKETKKPIQHQKKRLTLNSYSSKDPLYKREVNHGMLWNQEFKHLKS